ncbi:MAG: hypothetical protein E6K10_06280 [Methanobacteriota archaeon]|nr:MAG: hypothetical protein E6K10_06280 [Euryarchaeota archaeon]
MSERADLVDWIAAALFALASVELGLWGFWMMLSLIALPLGLVVLVVALLSWYAAKGVFSRDREAWWVGLLVAGLGTLIWLPEILLRVRFGVVLANEELAFSVLGLFLLVYLVLRRDRYGIGRRLPASMTLGYTAEKAK